jgi:Domain of unknown function (DUF4384)
VSQYFKSVGRGFLGGTRSGLLVLLTACGGSRAAQTPNAASPSGATSCEGQMRQALDCASEVAYQGADVKGGLSVLGIGNASGDVEQKALREIDEQTALYISEARRLCDEYNKCVIDRDAYATRSENLRRRLAKVPELVDDVRAAASDEARRSALSKAYRELVPAEGRTELTLDLSVVAQRPAEADMTPIAADAALPSGTHVAFLVNASRLAHVYLFQKSATGKISVLFPDPRIQLANPVPAGVTLRVPPEGASFRLDEKDIGSESVFIVASLHPIAELAAAAAHLSADRPAAAEPALGRVAAIDPHCKSRGFSLEQDRAPGCVRARGLMLDSSEAPHGTSLSTATEAADDTLANVFRFEHTL